ncbi:GNAT family N-acetyltransferase/peptidase C39 family protein [Roseibium sediminicola]|uniref:GNAT family N-acetyltransferase/peptidase C39 family protein n=1 Tax=Roseibium sediminicola TaxID=2933272 RepID=A0ABT0GYN1_9HYPH|nr:GNAT family N-acetyltransferase/peptidase C39 family protein [Roseibium sp. CAU 1639]MCK7614542.1 GNAT family N-acetyltransferase/peptidase C39 family protein [Roseibium sp. CAU 1639]
MNKAFPQANTRDILIRKAEASDLADLVRIENSVFDGDRISRRSFRRFLESAGACLLVAEDTDGVVGYVLLLLRQGTALARLYSLAVSPDRQGQGLGARLLDAAEAAAFEHDRIVLRLEVREDNAGARGLYEQGGYKALGRVPGYYEDGSAALRMEKLLHGPKLGTGRAPYYSQTTDFTCGPACALMALTCFDRGITAGPLEELDLWREATTIFLASGHGGCGPFGLANALARRGLSIEVRLSPDEPLFLTSVRNPEKRKILQLVQEGYREEATRLGIGRSDQPLDATGLGQAVAVGALAIVLISGYRMFGQKVPHWVLVHGADARHLIIHDPWLEHERHESPADAANLPIPFAEFDRMARWGRTAVRAQILIKKDA